ncbi:Conserved_hypothetical protein [Hexamita inflata]|uniref:Uncharacterized protein n=1 Tax=Hexamita inflata TaxID=28002 RepID=A0AA86TDH4_9EUKA|nr:Conserved hypothetical protein [Hexamita inflata]
MNLVELDLWINNIQDISEIKQIRGLTRLNLRRNQIIDISALGINFETKKLDLNLKCLDLSSNKIINIDALEYQRGFEELYLYHNYIQDFSPLKNHIQLLEPCFSDRGYTQFTVHELINPMESNYGRNLALLAEDETQYTNQQHKLDEKQIKYQNNYQQVIATRKLWKKLVYKKKITSKSNFNANVQLLLQSAQENILNCVRTAALLLSSMDSCCEQ